MTHPADTAERLTAEQVRVLTWIRDTPHHISRWLNEYGKTPSKRKPNFAIMELVGETGSIRFSAEVQESVRGYVQPADFEDRTRIFDLNDAGRAVLATADPTR